MTALEYLRNRDMYDVTNKANHKFFPFYFFTSANVTDLDEPHCSVCGEHLATNYAGYFSAYWLFESSDNVRICCSRKELPAGSWEFYNQRWGNSEPIKLPDHMKGREPYEVIMTKILTGSNLYRLKSYRHVTYDDLNNMFIPSLSGGSYGDGLWVKEEYLKIKITSRDNKVIHSFSQAAIVAAINEILQYNNNTQLSLF